MFVGGLFTTAGGQAVTGVAKFRSGGWSAFQGGTDGAVQSMATHPSANGGLDLFMGGAFTHAGGIESRYIARYSSCGPTTGLLFCPGDGTQFPCPCGNDSASGSGAGCMSSIGTGGKLVAFGLASLTNDTVSLSGTQMPSSSALYFQGTAQVNGGLGLPFGDGLRCVSGSVRRLGVKQNLAGASSYPQGGDLPVSVAGAVAPGTRYYQVWYRNSAPFCNPESFNLTNGWVLTWAP